MVLSGALTTLSAQDFVTLVIRSGFWGLLFPSDLLRKNCRDTKPVLGENGDKDECFTARQSNFSIRNEPYVSDMFLKLLKFWGKGNISSETKDICTSIRRKLSMKEQSLKIQTLYDHCKKIFTLNGVPPSSQAVQTLCSILDTVYPPDVGLTNQSTDNDRGHGFFGIIGTNRAARWAQPITYIDVHEGNSFTICVFCFPTSSALPLHDHPGMTVFSKVLYGSMHVKAYDWVEPASIIESKGPGHPRVRLAKLAVDKVLSASCKTSVLYPKTGGNLHCFTAVTPCAVLDVLSPPYREDAGRKCTYYHDYPYSSFSGNGANICSGEEEDYAWLAEIDTPDDLYMRQGVYTGPTILL